MDLDKILNDNNIVYQKNNNEYIASFWSNKQRQGNSLHEISYRACFKSELPNFFIKLFSKKNDWIYDPFMGRGTTVLESLLLNRNCIGNDINPLSQMLIEPRLNNINYNDVENRLENITLTNYNIGENKDLLAFYHPKTLEHLLCLKNYFLDHNLDMIDKWIRMIALNRLTGHSPGFFSGYTLPPNQAVSIKSQLKINKRKNLIHLEKNIKHIILKKTKSLLLNEQHISNSYILTCSDSRKNITIDDNKIDLIITSPPFLNVIDYNEDNWLRMWFANIEPPKISIYKNIHDWSVFISKCIKDYNRVLKSGGICCIEVGDVKKGKDILKNIVVDAMKIEGFHVLGVLINKQEFSKTSSIWGMDNNKKGTNFQYIIIGQKE